jgi:hypothetical protein
MDHSPVDSRLKVSGHQLDDSVKVDQGSFHFSKLKTASAQTQQLIGVLLNLKSASPFPPGQIANRCQSLQSADDMLPVPLYAGR